MIMTMMIMMMMMMMMKDEMRSNAYAILLDTLPFLRPLRPSCLFLSHHKLASSYLLHLSFPCFCFRFSIFHFPFPQLLEPRHPICLVAR